MGEDVVLMRDEREVIAWAEEHCIPVAYCAVDDERCGGAYRLRNRGGVNEVEAVVE